MSERPSPERLAWLLLKDNGGNKGFSSLCAEVRALQQERADLRELAESLRKARWRTCNCPETILEELTNP